MKQWEYFILDQIHVFNMNGLQQLINEYGAGRWELVSVDNKIMYFKREKRS